jgi:hypothetical protein
MSWIYYYDIYFEQEYQGTVNNWPDFMDLCFGDAERPPQEWGFTINRFRITVTAPCVNNGKYDMDIAGGRPNKEPLV